MVIEKCTINTLTLADGDESPAARHVVGTQLEDLSQVYSGKVTIRGSLRLENVFLEHPNIVSVGGQPLQMDVQSQYWMKSTDQASSIFFMNNKFGFLLKQTVLKTKL